jgi:hypothetical protein
LFGGEVWVKGHVWVCAFEEFGKEDETKRGWRENEERSSSDFHSKRQLNENYKLFSTYHHMPSDGMTKRNSAFAIHEILRHNLEK